MEVFIRAFIQMLILASMVAVGFYCRRKGLMNAEFDANFSSIVMTFTLPALILNSVLGNTDLPSTETILMMLGYSIMVYGFASVFAFLVGRYLFRGCKPNTKGAFAFLIAFGNTGFMGFPVIASLFGYNFVILAAVYNIGFNLFLFSVGMLFISRTGTSDKKTPLKQEVVTVLKTLITPTMISCYVSVGLVVFGITDNGGPIGKATELLGGVTVPAAMMLVGSSLAKMNVREMFGDKWVYVATLFRLIIMPLLAYFLLGFIIDDRTILAIITIICGMPAATVGTMMCITYGGDIDTMTKGTFITTIFSVISIPIVAMLVI